MHILLSGGGTLGPVMPLLALVDSWREKQEPFTISFIGTRRGPEREVIERMGIPFTAITSAKWPRYWTFYWFLFPFLFALSLFESWRVIRRERPQVVVSAGGFVSVPLAWAAWLHRIPVWLHQQDVIPGLANRLMAPFAKKVSVAFAPSASAFSPKKTQVLGNPVRAQLYAGQAKRAVERFSLASNRPTVLVLGGGTGSAWMNACVDAMADTLVSEGVQLLHIAGKGKAKHLSSREGYVVEELVVDGMEDVYALADVVLCRAGLGTLSELAALHKSALVIPLPDSHQEANALFLFEQRGAVILDQAETTPQVLLTALRTLCKDLSARRALGERLHSCFPPDARDVIAEGVWQLGQSQVQKQAKDWSVVVEKKKEGTSEGENAPSLESEIALESQETSLNPEEQQVVLSIEEQIARALEQGRNKNE